MSKLEITLANSTGAKYTLFFNILDTEIASKWLVELQKTLDLGTHLDDPERLYGFNGSKYTVEYCINTLNEFVDTINRYQQVCEKHVNYNYTQDDLNYLHNIFERYHGLYDAQDSNEFYSNAPKDVQYALGQLNIYIHRLESINSYARFVCTFSSDGRPRIPFAPADYKHFTMQEVWGGLYINYCEIGKTLVDMYRDNDEHIGNEAFIPQQYFKSDFNVKFTHHTPEEYAELEQNVINYYEKNLEKFVALGHFDPKFALGSIQVGQLSFPDDIDKKAFEEHYLSEYTFIDSLRIDYV